MFSFGNGNGNDNDKNNTSKRFFKKGFDTSTARKKREQFSLDLRKGHKNSALTKRRLFESEKGNIAKLLIEQSLEENDDEKSETKSISNFNPSPTFSFDKEAKESKDIKRDSKEDLGFTPNHNFMIFPNTSYGQFSNYTADVKADISELKSEELKAYATTIQNAISELDTTGNLPAYNELFNALKKIRLHTCEKGAKQIYKQIIALGLLPRLVKIIHIFYSHIEDEKCFKLVYECAWIISNCCSSKLSITRQVITCNVLLPLISLFMCGNEELADVALYGLGNIAADGVFWEQICEHLDLSHCLRRAETFKKVETVVGLTWFIRNLFLESKKTRAGSDSSKLTKIYLPTEHLERIRLFFMYCIGNYINGITSLPASSASSSSTLSSSAPSSSTLSLSTLSPSTPSTLSPSTPSTLSPSTLNNAQASGEIINNVLSVLKHASDCDDESDEVIGVILSMGLHRGLLQQLCVIPMKDSSLEEIQKLALNILGNLMRGRKLQYAIEILNPSFEIIPMWKHLLSLPLTNKAESAHLLEIKRLVLWSISNVVCENEACILEIFKSDGLILTMLDIMRKNVCTRCNTEIYHIIHNLCYSDLYDNVDKYLLCLMENDVLKVMVRSLSKTSSSHDLKLVLESFVRFYRLYEIRSVCLPDSGSNTSVTPACSEEWKTGKLIFDDFQNNGCWDIINQFRDHDNKKVAALAGALVSNFERLQEIRESVENRENKDNKDNKDNMENKDNGDKRENMENKEISYLGDEEMTAIKTDE